MNASKNKWWQVWRTNFIEESSQLEKVARTYKEVSKEHKKKEFEIITIHQKVEAAYKIVVRVLVGILSIGVIIGFIKEYQKEDLIIEPLLVYDELKKQGFEGTVLCSSIIDKINEIKEFANTSKETQAFRKQSTVKPIQVRLPIVGSGFSLNTVYEQVKIALGKSPKIVSGSIMQYGKKTTININVTGKSFRKTVVTDSTAVDRLIEFAAMSIIRQTEPYLLAAYYIQKKDLDNAMEVSRYCLTHEPKSDDKWAYLIMGRAEFMKRNEQAAIEYCKKAIQIDKKFVNAYTNWGLMLQTSTKNPDYEQAIQKYKEAIKINPKYVNAYLNWGTTLHAQKKYNEAIEKLKTAYSLDKNDKIIPHRIGYAYYEMKKYDEAIDWYKKSLEIDPTYINAYWGIIEAVREKRHNIDEAMFFEIVENALELDKYSIIPYFDDKELHKFIYKNDKFKELFREYYQETYKNKENILSEYADSEDALITLAISSREMKDYKSALLLYEKVMEMKNYEIEALYGKLICYTQLAQKKQAIQTAKQLLEIDKEYKEYFYHNPVLSSYLAHPDLVHLFN
ncbi:MAG: tetratricopeptide repeat protein [Bacteroidia bacterium]|nr:tetratricopeptide repeat protein [Bacteroidia bacterium]